ncbi:MAG: transcription antitermination factor NusB [Planctomycetota bacterium]
MADPRTIRRLAFQALYQFDASGGAAIDLSGLEGGASLTPGEQRRVLALAEGAFANRGQADAAFAAFAPEWPAHRQPAVDRAVLRLAYFEMLSGRTPPKVAITEAVRLAESFSTKKSPAFVNGVLDKLFKQLDRFPPIQTDQPDDQIEPAGAAPGEGA